MKNREISIFRKLKNTYKKKKLKNSIKWKK